MPTPMNAFAIIAARYGVDPADEDAVDRFFDERAPNLPLEEREAILADLLVANEGDSPARTRYAKAGNDVSFKNDPAIKPPLRAVNPGAKPQNEIRTFPERVDLSNPQAFLAKEWKNVERLIESVCRRRGLSGADADRFASEVKIGLFKHDYAIIRQFRGQTRCITYLKVVIHRMFTFFMHKH